MKTVLPRLTLAFLVLTASGAAGGGPLFGVPVAWPEPGSPELAALPAVIQGHSDALASRPAAGYDWVFPEIYAKTSRSIVGATGTGFFEDPELVGAEVASFYEIYAANAAAWLAGRRAEPGWAFCAGLSRRLGALDGAPGGNEARAAALVQAFATVYVHVAIDLPRALYMVHHRLEPARRMQVLRATHHRITACFYPVLEELIAEARITPAFLAKVWPKLPAWMRGFLVRGRLGFGAYLRLLRSLAWIRFRALARKDAHRGEVEALPARPGLHPLPPLPAGPAAPGRALPDAELDRLGERVFDLRLGL